jgi:AcrR family transcriptional regulator
MPDRRTRLEPRKEPVQKRSRATVDELLLAAAQVFEALGYAAATTNRIAQRAGVSIGTLYQYFPSKEAVAVALLERHLAETDQRLQQWVEGVVPARQTLRGALHDYVAGMLDMHSGRPRLQHILLEEIPLPERVHLTLIDAERRAAVTVAGVLEAYPEIRRAHLEQAAFLLVQTVESLTHRFAAHPAQQMVSRERFVNELVTMLEAYLTFLTLS